MRVPSINDIKSDQGYVHIEVVQFLYKTDYFPQLEGQLQEKREKLTATDNFKKRKEINKEREGQDG